MHQLFQEYFTASLIYSELHRRLQELIKPYGVSPQQAIVLATIKDEKMTCSEISEVMKVSLPTVTLLTNPLHKQGFVIKRKGDTNKKIRTVEITAKGRLVLAVE